MTILLRTEVRPKCCGLDVELALCDVYVLRGRCVYDVGSVMFRQNCYWNPWSNFGIGV